MLRTFQMLLVSNSCPPERGDNPRALAARGLSYVQVDVTILYHLDQCRLCTCTFEDILTVVCGSTSL